MQHRISRIKELKLKLTIDKILTIHKTRSKVTKMVRGWLLKSVMVHSRMHKQTREMKILL